MRVALVFNPFVYKLHEENLRIVQRYFGLFPPLSLAWVAASVAALLIVVSPLRVFA